MSGQFDVVDFVTVNHGSVVMFIPKTQDAEDAMDVMDLATWQFMGEGFVVDHRVAVDLIDALHEDGFMVS
jgi:hypothetical protein